VIQRTLLTVGAQIAVRVVKGGIQTPGPDVPCIFVGPGTGIAPMRAMIEQRLHNDDKGDLPSLRN